MEIWVGEHDRELGKSDGVVKESVYGTSGIAHRQEDSSSEGRGR